MYQRRPAASLVSLLVVTSLFAWACSSGDHEEASVTTSGGAGSQVSAGSAAPSDADDGSDLGIGGTIDVAAPPSMNNEGGSAEEVPPEIEPATGGQPQVSSGGSSSTGNPPLALGGTISGNGAGAPGAGAPSAGAASAGAPAAGGAPAVVEPVCDPGEDRSTPDMALPCDVSTALYVCRHCHSNPPVKGVFTSYVTYAEIKANAPQIYGVIKSGTMPWPPYTMSAWQKTTVLKWLGKNGSCAIGAAKSCQ
jgi:hypothetical protein